MTIALRSVLIAAAVVALGDLLGFIVLVVARSYGSAVLSLLALSFALASVWCCLFLLRERVY